MPITAIVDWRIRCDHQSCGQQRFLAADDLEQAVRKAIASYGWVGDARHIECPKHKEAVGG